jgi:phospholipase C
MRRVAVTSALYLCVATLFSSLALSQSVTVNPTSISFGSKAEGTASQPYKVTLKNGQTKAIIIASISTNLVDFSQSSNCPLSPTILPAGATCTISVVFSPTALGARNGNLTVVDTGTSSPQVVTLAGTGTPPNLVSIAVTPSPASIVAGNAEQFTATGTYSNGSMQNVSSIVSWTSSAPAVAKVNGQGLATGLAAGISTIKAAVPGISGSATLTVTALALVSISVTPSTSSIPAGNTQQFTATGNYNNGNTQNLTAKCTWTSSSTIVATVNNAGLAKGVSQGSATITANYQTINGSANLSVTPPALVSIAVSPATATIAAGNTQQFTATGVYSDGSEQNLTGSVSWSSSANAVATIVAGGLATGEGVGTATISASLQSITGTATLTVGAPVLISLAVSPANASFAVQTTQPFTAIGIYSDGSTQNVSGSVNWSSGNAGIVTVNGQGLASAVGMGSTTVTATLPTISGSALATVTGASLAEIVVTPAIPSVPEGMNEQFRATGIFTDGSTQDVTGIVQWSSGTPTVATISNASGTVGLATSVAQGTTTVMASAETVSGSTMLTVTGVSLVSIAISPAAPSVGVGVNEQLTATGTFTDGSTQNLTSAVSWSSSNAAVATISNTSGTVGLATSVAQGTTTITASMGTVNGGAMLTVTPATVVSIAISPSQAAIGPGTNQQFTALGTFSDGSTQDLTQSGHWSSTAGGVATISDTVGMAGLASAQAAGTTTITINFGSVIATATLVVNPVTLVSMTISPQNPTISLGAMQQFTATGTFTDGSTQNLTSVVTWSSSNATVATISNWAGSYGLASSAGQGTATIGAMLESVSTTTGITVEQPTIVSIAVTPSTATITLGGMEQFTATATYSDGSTQNVSNTATWTSSAVMVATVNGSGLATGVGSGSTTITASQSGINGSAGLTVLPALVSIAVSPATATIAAGNTQQFTATGVYSDGSEQNLTGSVSWSSSANAVATIVAGGLATGEGVGTATISASLQSITGTATLTVTAPVLVSISVTPETASVPAGQAQQFTATGTYSDGSMQNLTTSATWTSSNNTVAYVKSGLATSESKGTTTITATSGVKSGSATLTVTSAVLVSITVTPATVSLVAGYTEQFTATGTYSNGTKQNVSSAASWSSAPMSVAAVASGGRGAALSQGTATITAALNGISGLATMTVSPATLSSIAVTPTATLLTAGSSLQFTATGTYTNGSTQNLTGASTWTSSLAGVASVSSSGLVTSAESGMTIISASSGIVSGSATLNVTNASAQISHFQHIIVIVQENRTPDNLFQGLCEPPYGTSNSCSSTPTGSQYGIQTANWLDKTSPTGVTQPVTVPLANQYDLNHSHSGFIAMCDQNAIGICLMDGAAGVTCTAGTCPTRPQYAYVDNSTGILNPYLTLATQYGWANYMFQTNQGPSFPAHQFLFGATSAPSPADDAAGIFASENGVPSTAAVGCTALTGTAVAVIGPAGENASLYPPIYPCFEHQTMADLLQSSGISWKYYTSGSGSIWTAPNAIEHICGSTGPGGQCTGSDWINNVVLTSARILTDISSCTLPQVSWVIPTGQNSDHADINDGGGPSWVASIINSLGTQPQCADGEVYWNNTAILITWDDWGGWYDHQAPTFLGYPQGAYQTGFRVPLVVVSAYTPAAFVDNNRLDFGSILRFIQYNFGIEEGALNFGDARSQVDLTEFFNLTQAPRPFLTIPAQFGPDYFLNDKSPPADPDDD